MKPLATTASKQASGQAVHADRTSKYCPKLRWVRSVSSYFDSPNTPLESGTYQTQEEWDYTRYPRPVSKPETLAPTTRASRYSANSNPTPEDQTPPDPTRTSSGTSAKACCVSWETWKMPSIIPEEHGAICLNARPPSLDEYSADACNQASATPDACNHASE